VAQDHRERTHEVCHNVRVRDRPKDDHRIAGTAIGAVAGGLLGHQIGGGKGKTLAYGGRCRGWRLRGQPGAEKQPGEACRLPYRTTLRTRAQLTWQLFTELTPISWR
jgi:Predicted outer membrane lipoprotein